MRLTGFIIAMHKKIRRLPSGKQRKEYIQFVEKVCFFKKCLFSIPIPKPLSPGKGLNVGLPPSPRLGLRPKPHF